MKITGGIISRGFSPQRCFSFIFDCYFSNWSGSYLFGFSRPNDVRTSVLNFSSGAAFLPWFTPFPRVFSWNASEKINVSGNVCSGDISLYFNNYSYPIVSRLFAGGTGAVFTGFYITGSNCEADFDFKIFGSNKPSYSLMFSNTGYLTGENISGLLVNNSPYNFSAFRIFSGSAVFENNSSYYLRASSITGTNNITGGSSRLFYLDFDPLVEPNYITNTTGLSNLRGSLLLDTDFGLSRTDISIPVLKSPYYSASFENIYSGTEDYNLVWTYDLNRAACSGLNYEVIIQPSRWFESEPFSGVVSGNTGLYNGNLEIPGSGASIAAVSSNLLSGRGFIPASGCAEDGLLAKMKFNLTFKTINNYNLNLINYTVRSLNSSEPLINFSGTLTAGWVN